VPILLDKQRGSLFDEAIKNKTPQVADNNLRGHQSHAIAHMRLDNFILSQSREKGKAQNDVSCLQHQLQEIWEVRKEENPTLSVQPMR